MSNAPPTPAPVITNAAVLGNIAPAANVLPIPLNALLIVRRILSPTNAIILQTATAFIAMVIARALALRPTLVPAFLAGRTLIVLQALVTATPVIPNPAGFVSKTAPLRPMRPVVLTEPRAVLTAAAEPALAAKARPLTLVPVYPAGPTLIALPELVTATPVIPSPAVFV